MMRCNRRIQIAADADITVFNPQLVIDKGTFENGPNFSEGIEYVIVNGLVALMQGITVEHVFAGQPVFGRFKQ